MGAFLAAIGNFVMGGAELVSKFLPLLIISAVVAGEWYISAFLPTGIPEPMQDDVVVFLNTIWAWNGIFPIDTIIDDLVILINIVIGLFFVKFLLWMIVSINGGHEPSMD